MITAQDRACELVVAPGTGSFSLAGANTAGHAAISASSGATLLYCAETADGSQWEIGEGVYTSGVLTRDFIHASSGGLVDFSGPVTLEVTLGAAAASTDVPASCVFEAYLGADTSTSTGSFVKVPIDTVGANSGFVWDATNKRLSVGSPGWYRFELGVDGNTNIAWKLRLNKNGSTFRYSGAPAGASSSYSQSMRGQVVAYCTPSDYFELYYSSGASAPTLSAGDAKTFMRVFGPIDGPTPEAFSPAHSNALDKCAVTLAASYSTGSGAQKVPYDTVVADTGGIWSAANKRFVPRKPGYYRLSARTKNTGSAASKVLSLYKNGAVNKVLGSDCGTLTYGAEGSAMVYCDGVSDFIEVYMTASSGYAQSTSPSEEWASLEGPL